jgi:hypothetical protein
MNQLQKMGEPEGEIAGKEVHGAREETKWEELEGGGDLLHRSAVLYSEKDLKQVYTSWKPIFEVEFFL